MRLLFFILLIPTLLFSQEEFKQFYYPNGSLSSEGILKNGKPEGYWKTYYDTGALKAEGNRLNFLLDSIWKFYDVDGIITKEISYKEGKKNGFETTFQDSFKYESVNYRNGIKDGPILRYYLDSLQKVIYQGEFTNGSRSGKAYGFDKEGRINLIEEYQNGQLLKVRRVNLFDSNGRKQGSWVWFDSNRNIIKEGFFKNDLENGYFKYYDKKGNLVKTEKYSNGDLVNDAIELAKLDIKKTYYPNNTLKSKKSYRNNIPDGIHQEFDENGKSISTLIYKLGKVSSVGGFIDDKGLKQGIWTEYYDNAKVKSKGLYIDGQKEGEWEYFYSDGSLEQRGSYKDGKSNGTWKWFYKDSSLLREETFVMGKENGSFSEFDKSGSLIVFGEFISGKKQGKWYYFNEKIKSEGEYDFGLKVGKWIDINTETDKIIKESNYYEGVLDGEYREYSKDGVLIVEGKYENGLKQGLWNYYNQNGYNKVTIKYKDGVDLEYDNTKTIKVEEYDAG